MASKIIIPLINQSPHHEENVNILKTITKVSS
jgi:hypothetical protein